MIFDWRSARYRGGSGWLQAGLVVVAVGVSLPAEGIGGTYRRIPVEERFSWQKPITSFLSTPPGTPAKADRYVVGAAATGAWTAHETEIAWYDGTAWSFDVPADGWFLFSVADSQLYVFDGTAWAVYPSAIWPVLTADPASPADMTGWLVATGTSPTRTLALRIRDGGVTVTIASITR